MTHIYTRVLGKTAQMCVIGLRFVSLLVTTRKRLTRMSPANTSSYRENTVMELTSIHGGMLLTAEGNRDPALPQLYEVFDHPLRPKGSRSLVYLADLSPEGQEKTLALSARQRLPGPGYKAAKNSGIWQFIGYENRTHCVLHKKGAIFLQPEDMLFIRDRNGSGNAVDDIARAWVVSRRVASTK